MIIYLNFIILFYKKAILKKNTKKFILQLYFLILLFYI